VDIGAQRWTSCVSCPSELRSVLVQKSRADILGSIPARSRWWSLHLQQTLPEVTQITNAAAANAARSFPLNVRGSAIDTMEFYSWVIDDMMREPFAIPDPDPIWNEELEALYRIDLRRLIICRAPGCGRTIPTGTMTPNPWFLSVDYHLGTMNILVPMIYNYFELGTRQVHCAACGVFQPHADFYRFDAAPQVLRIYVRLFGYQGNRTCQ
jgi:hypothetical protein